MGRSYASRSSIRFDFTRARLFSAALVAGTCLFAAGTADAMNASQCRRLTRQIDQYKGVAEMAANRGDRLWLKGTLNHVQRLSDRRIKQCPQFDQPSQAEVMAQWLKETAHIAAKGFIRYMTFGIY
jgi:hypothetical protein